MCGIVGAIHPFIVRSCSIPAQVESQRDSAGIAVIRAACTGAAQRRPEWPNLPTWPSAPGPTACPGSPIPAGPPTAPLPRKTPPHVSGEGLAVVHNSIITEAMRER